MDGMFVQKIERLEADTRHSAERRIIVRGLLLTVIVALVTLGAVLTLDAFGVRTSASEFPAVLDAGP